MLSNQRVSIVSRLGQSKVICILEGVSQPDVRVVPPLHLVGVLAFTFLAVSSTAIAQPSIDDLAASEATSDDAAPPKPVIAPVKRPSRPEIGRTTGVDWKGVFTQSSMFLAAAHSFRVATEPGTRDMPGPYFQGYLDSVGNLHGWSDGDPFLVNYVGHTLQGAVASFIWIHNDGRYRYVEFGKSPDYWRSRLRAAGWSLLYSTQFEIGPVSEASIGHIQKHYPQVGFVDHVITPSIGLGWTIAEDALDRFVVRPFEDRVENFVARIMVRGWLNPARSFSNAMAFRTPWHRDTRPGVREYFGRTYDQILPRDKPVERPKPLVAPFETAFLAKVQTYSGQGLGDSCLGGGSSNGLRVANQWQMVLEVSGCELFGLGARRPHLSGDSLSLLVGPRWTPAAARRWSPFAEFLVGVNKVTNEYFTPEAREAYLEATRETNGKPPDYKDYADFRDSTGLQIQAGTGVDVRLSRAFAWRVASVGYSRSWIKPINGIEYNAGLHFSSGLILRMGTW